MAYSAPAGDSIVFDVGTSGYAAPAGGNIAFSITPTEVHHIVPRLSIPVSFNQVSANPYSVTVPAVTIPVAGRNPNFQAGQFIPTLDIIQVSLLAPTDAKVARTRPPTLSIPVDLPYEGVMYSPLEMAVPILDVQVVQLLVPCPNLVPLLSLPITVGLPGFSTSVHLDQALEIPVSIYDPRYQAYLFDLFGEAALTEASMLTTIELPIIATGDVEIPEADADVIIQYDLVSEGQPGAPTANIDTKLELTLDGEA